MYVCRECYNNNTVLHTYLCMYAHTCSIKCQPSHKGKSLQAQSKTTVDSLFALLLLALVDDEGDGDWRRWVEPTWRLLHLSPPIKCDVVSKWKKLIKASSRLHTNRVAVSEHAGRGGAEVAALAHKRPIKRCDVVAAITSVRIFHAHRDVPRTNTFVYRVHTHMHTLTYLLAREFVCVCVYVFVCTHACVHAHMCSYLCMYNLCMWVVRLRRTYAVKWEHTHTYTYSLTCTHTYVCVHNSFVI